MNIGYAASSVGEARALAKYSHKSLGPTRKTSAVIDALDLSKLSNKVRGHRSSTFGRALLEEVIVRYAATPVEIREPSVLIRIKRRYRPGMSAQELYESTRGVWVVGKRRKTLKHAMAVYDGVIREVHRIYRSRARQDVRDPRRWEFLGSIAEPRVRNRYRGVPLSTFFCEFRRIVNGHSESS